MESVGNLATEDVAGAVLFVSPEDVAEHDLEGEWRVVAMFSITRRSDEVGQPPSSAPL